jgi:hypothetical protein
MVTTSANARRRLSELLCFMLIKIPRDSRKGGWQDTILTANMQAMIHSADPP